MEITQLLKPTAAQYATFVEKGFSLDLDFLNAYDWSTELVEQNPKKKKNRLKIILNESQVKRLIHNTIKSKENEKSKG